MQKCGKYRPRRKEKVSLPLGAVGATGRHREWPRTAHDAWHFPPVDEYITAATQDMALQLSKASVRLAFLLNTRFASYELLSVLAFLGAVVRCAPIAAAPFSSAPPP
jgi:hypothetical protein